MILNTKSTFLSCFLLSMVAYFLISGCASIQRPQGGPRDKTPPKILDAIPKNLTRNFSSNKIELTFDEYFKLTNQFQEISIIPESDQLPEIKVRKKTLSIAFTDSLQKNTTYVINFGKAIADVNENNVLTNFTYVFSTGNQIDSLFISGTVTNNLNLQKEKDATVFIFPVAQDTLFGKKKPAIYTTSDSSGNFKIGNLKEGKYRIYAIKEESPNKIFDNEKELVAFLKDSINLTKDTTNVQLSLFKQQPAVLKLIDRRIDPDGKLFFTFNKGIDSPSIKIIDPAALDGEKIIEYSDTADSAIVYLKNMSFDSIRIAIASGNTPIDTVTFRKGKKETFSRTLALTYNLNSEQQLSPKSNFTINANYPISSFNASKIIILEDSIPIKGFTIEKETANTKKFVLKYPWKQEKSYKITVDAGSFKTIYNDENKKIINTFTVNKLENYGLIVFNVQVPDSSAAYVVELLDEKKEVLNSKPISKSTIVNYPDYPIGTYNLRIIYDTNKNGKWDSGNVKERLQPEKVWYFEKPITLRANWEAEEKIEIPK
ncbi:MAG: Ig-like domain-containing protein [Sphingobacteriaceae bacterium]